MQIKVYSCYYKLNNGTNCRPFHKMLKSGKYSLYQYTVNIKKVLNYLSIIQ